MADANPSRVGYENSQPILRVQNIEPASVSLSAFSDLATPVGGVKTLLV